MAISYPKDLLRDLLEGNLSPERIWEIQHAPKDSDRCDKVVSLEQERVPWSERIIVCLQEHLYIVEKRGERIIKCSCGHEFGDYRTNWKESALVYERNPQDGEVYFHTRAADPDFMVLREFYCPGCGSQLEVEAVPPGYPFIFSFLPDLDS
ncbi:MAG: acetone carboxylase subunit gamma [Chloroflexi bacterium]|nr:acetone carboxylase subunit gamma [Chloroflexota bacterium]